MGSKEIVKKAHSITDKALEDLVTQEAKTDEIFEDCFADWEKLEQIRKANKKLEGP